MSSWLENRYTIKSSWYSNKFWDNSQLFAFLLVKIVSAYKNYNIRKANSGLLEMNILIISILVASLILVSKHNVLIDKT